MSCPCALSLATPAALAAAGASLSRRGVLLTRGHALETLAQVSDVVLDKTGTLTEGRFALAEVRAAQGAPADQCPGARRRWRRQASIPSHRPWWRRRRRCRAATAADGEGTPPQVVPVAALRSVPGQGLEARIGARRLRLGRRPSSRNWREARPGDLLHGAAEPDLPAGATTVWLGEADRWLAAFVLHDVERARTGVLLARLRRLGVRCHRCPAMIRRRSTGGRAASASPMPAAAPRPGQARLCERAAAARRGRAGGR